ncbi:MAG: SUMF1/EgtB/PvdO family nonheme iron enzyme [Planctomycetes bacterium]|nr:SUMF1/EgtB/PvdO family nonheme iron enzyme [Planctomycetota bacterium]
MKPADEIRQLFKNAELGINPDADEMVFEDVFSAHKETTENTPAMPDIWRIIMKSRKAQFTAAAVVVLITYLCLQIPKNLVAPAYALQDTIEAHNSIRYLHVSLDTFMGAKCDLESWIEFDEDGKPRRYRVQADRTLTGDQIGPVTIVHDGDGLNLWLPNRNTSLRRLGKSVVVSQLLQWDVFDVNPKLVCEKLRQQARNGEIILDVNEPDQKNEPIVLVVTYPAESRSANWKKVLYIDQATRLVKKEEKFEMRDGQYRHEKTIEFFDYNQQIDPQMFNLEGELPENVIWINLPDKEIGLAQVDMTDEEIATEVVLQFLQAFIAKDYDKAGQLFLGIPGFLTEKMINLNVLKIISVGPAHRDPDPDSNLMICSCKTIFEIGEQNFELEAKLYTVPVSGQPGRWMICKIFGSSKPAPGVPKPLEMVLIPSGTFMMGSSSDEQDRDPDEGPQHQATLTQGFYLGKYEITVGQYVAFLEATGEESSVDWNDDNCPLLRSSGRYTLRDGQSWNQPMVEVSWYGAAMYCNYLSEKEGLESVYNLDTWEVDWNANGYRLPTEAEWEYACRAGTQTRFYWGDDPEYMEINDYCWSDGDGWKEVGQKRPNAFGLYDMSGNVYEWCQDWYGNYIDSSQTDPIGPSSGSTRVLRGGFRDEDARHCRSANRYKISPDERHSSIGFRLLRLDVPKPLEMVLISPGKFMMGSPSDEQDRDPDEGPQHQVTLTQGFYMGKYEVTVGQYVAFLEATGEESGVDWNDHDCPLSRDDGRYTLRDGRSWNQPMAEVSWYGAVMYCNYVSEKEGLQTVYNLDTWEVDWNANGYRLPTEAEWEYACRAGTQTRFYWGNDPVNSQEIPNAFGLYHMSGNVYEWCQDWYGSYGDSDQIDPIGSNSGSNRVLRGGHSCRSAHRYKNSPDEWHTNIGFRLLRLNP